MALVDNVWYVDGGAQPGATNVTTVTNTAGATLATGNLTIPAGALIIVAVTETGTASAGTLADGPGNSYSSAATSAIPTAAGFAKIFYIANCLALTAQAITYTKAASGNFTIMQVCYVTGIATATPLDATTTTVATGTGTAVSVTSGVPTQNGEFLFSCIANATTPTSFGATLTGWINQVSQVSATGALWTGNDIQYGGLGSVTFTNTLGGSVGWAAFVVGFKIASIVGYGNISGWAASTTYVTGNLIRQSTPSAINNERVFVAIASTAGTGQSGATEPSWTVTRGAKTTDNTVTWQEATGIAALNGDATNTPSWTTVKASAPAVLGQVIAGTASGTASYMICTTPGTMGAAEPTWPAFTNAGATVTETAAVAVWTNIGAQSNFTGWQAPHARLANSFASTWGKAGNSFFVASEHAETQATANTLTSPGTAVSPCNIYCVAKTPVPPTGATTGARISTIATSAMTIGGVSAIYDGITFVAGSGTAAANIQVQDTSSGVLVFRNSSLQLGGTNGGNKINLGNSSVFTGEPQRIDLYNTTVSFATAGHSVTPLGNRLTWRNTASAILGTTPTILFTSDAAALGGAYVTLAGVDLSAVGSGKTLVAASLLPSTYVFIDCLLGASVTVAATPTSPGGRETYVIRSDSSGTNYRHEKYQYMGTQTVETTIIRTGGASDGTTPISWKIVTTANSKWVLPFECIPITVWCETTGSHTVTIYGTTTGGGVPNNDDIWITAEYLKDSGDPLGGFVTTTKSDNLAASTTTNNSSDASTWGGGGAGNGFKMVTPSFTVNQKGPITVYINVAKVSATYYGDPRPAISGITVNRSLILAPGVYANELGGGSGSFSYIS